MIEVLKYENLKYFFVAFLLSLPFWLGMNVLEKNLEEIFFWQEIAKNPQILTAQLSVEVKPLQRPLRDVEVKPLQIEAESAISVWLKFDSELSSKESRVNREEILFEKDAEKSLPIASLTKLMTAYIVLEYYPDLSQTIEISQEAVFQEGDFGNLKIGERLTAENLLYIMLIESSNDAAYALAEIIGPGQFLDTMNWEAKHLGMENTHFVDPMGISPENQSSVKDLIILTKELLNKSLIWEILEKPEFDLYGPDGVLHHKLINTNELLGKFENIMGGKTGYTEEAKGCFLLVLETPKNKGYLINVILGAENRFTQMEKLINFVTSN